MYFSFKQTISPSEKLNFQQPVYLYIYSGALKLILKNTVTYDLHGYTFLWEPAIQRIIKKNKISKQSLGK